jgi:hypothetical protein
LKWFIYDLWFSFVDCMGTLQVRFQPSWQDLHVLSDSLIFEQARGFSTVACHAQGFLGL